MELLEDNAGAVEAQLKTSGWIAPDERITHLEKAGVGNMNRTLRARLRLKSGGARSLILKQSVPFVARYPEIPAPLGRLAVEAAFYREIETYPSLTRYTPHILGYDPDNNLLCMEDFGPAADFSSYYDLSRRSEEVADQIPGSELIAWLGALHTLQPTDPVFENLEMRELSRQHIFEIPFDPENSLVLDPAITDIQARFRSDSALKKAAGALGEIYMSRSSHDSPDVLLHGDFYPGSWLRHEETVVKIIDPEFGFRGPPEFDIGIFFAHMTMIGYPQAALLDLLQNYEAPVGFNFQLALGFAGVEIIRRLLGVAQLPLQASATTLRLWLESAQGLITA